MVLDTLNAQVNLILIGPVQVDKFDWKYSY